MRGILTCPCYKCEHTVVAYALVSIKDKFTAAMNQIRCLKLKI